MRLLAFGIWHSLSAALFAPIFALLPDLWPPSNHPALLILFRRCSWRTRIAFGFRRLRKLAIPQHLPWASLFMSSMWVCVCVCALILRFLFLSFFSHSCDFSTKNSCKKARVIADSPISSCAFSPGAPHPRPPTAHFPTFSLHFPQRQFHFSLFMVALAASFIWFLCLRIFFWFRCSRLLFLCESVFADRTNRGNPMAMMTMTRWWRCRLFSVAQLWKSGGNSPVQRAANAVLLPDFARFSVAKLLIWFLDLAASQAPTWLKANNKYTA